MVLGFNAPKDVRIVRGEVADRDARARKTHARVSARPSDAEHLVLKHYAVPLPPRTSQSHRWPQQG